MCISFTHSPHRGCSIKGTPSWAVLMVSEATSPAYAEVQCVYATPSCSAPIVPSEKHETARSASPVVVGSCNVACVQSKSKLRSQSSPRDSCHAIPIQHKTDMKSPRYAIPGVNIVVEFFLIQHRRRYYTRNSSSRATWPNPLCPQSNFLAADSLARTTTGSGSAFDRHISSLLVVWGLSFDGEEMIA
jgi:hypothetical protein